MIGNLLQNRYRIVKELGKGGFGQTYRAEDINLNNKIRVVKKLQPQSTDLGVLLVARRLFQTESDVLNMLGENHPQIPQLLDRFEENQEFYLVQQYMPEEQEKGHPRLASDIYAVGIVGIIALTGSIPTQTHPKTLQIIWKNPLPSVMSLRRF